MTLDDIAARLGVRYLAVRPRMAARAMSRRGAHQDEVAHAMRMASYFSSGADAVVTDHVARLTGTPPRAIEAFLAEHHDAFSPATGLARTLSRTRSKEHS